MLPYLHSHAEFPNPISCYLYYLNCWLQRFSLRSKEDAGDKQEKVGYKWCVDRVDPPGFEKLWIGSNILLGVVDNNLSYSFAQTPR